MKILNPYTRYPQDNPISTPRLLDIYAKFSPTSKPLIHFPLGLSNHIFGLDAKFEYEYEGDMTNYSNNLHLVAGR